MSRGGREGGLDTVKLSKGLSWLLRHNAEKQGFKLLPGGFLPVNDILKHNKFSGYSVQDIELVVAQCAKQRFTLKTEDGVLLIRANQGHSIQSVEVEMEEITDPSSLDKVIHGTYYRVWDSIREKGLSRMRRQHIHCAAGEPGTAGVISGMRGTCQLYIYIDVDAAMREGIKFLRSSNNVILSPGDKDGFIRPDFFLKVKDVKKNLVIYPPQT